MNSEWFTTDQVRQLVDLLTVVAAAPDTSDEHRYELDYCRSQLAQQMPALEVFVLAVRSGPGRANDVELWL